MSLPSFAQDKAISILNNRKHLISCMQVKGKKKEGLPSCSQYDVVAASNSDGGNLISGTGKDKNRFQNGSVTSRVLVPTNSDSNC